MKLRKKDIALIITALVIIFSFIYSQISIALREDGLYIHFLDIGQGDATFITFPDGQQMLIDCAIDNRIMEALSRAMPFYDRTLDFLVITHPDMDHYGGCIDVLNRYEVKHIVYTGAQKKNLFFTTFDEKLKSVPSEYIQIDALRSWNIGGVDVQVLFPDKPIEDIDFDSNDTSIVLKMSYGDQDVLFTGDAEAELETYLVEKYSDQLDVEVLKAGHHGSDTSSNPDFLKVTKPDATVISVGEENKYGHPSGRVLKRFDRLGTNVWRTDTQGDIILHITTSTIHVEAYKKI